MVCLMMRNFQKMKHQIIMDIIRKFFKRNIISINEGRKKKDKIRIHLYEINNFDLMDQLLQLEKKILLL